MFSNFQVFGLVTLLVTQRAVENTFVNSSTEDVPIVTTPEHTGFLRIVTNTNLTIPQFSNKRDELLYWAKKQGNQHIIDTHLAEVAACVMVKDEHLDILEWIAYHKFIGIGKFYIYDNNSVPPMIDMLRGQLSLGLIDYQYLNDTFTVDDYLISRKFQEYKREHHWGGTTELINSVQVWSMTTCVRTYGERHKWIVLIDVDEFLVFEKVQLMPPPNLALFLKDYEEFGGVAIYRRNFGSSGHIDRPTEGVLASYTSCVEHLRSDIRQAYPKIILNSEYFQWSGGECRIHECSTVRSIVNSKKEELSSRWFVSSGTATWDKLRIHHYGVKSFQDFQIKKQRGMPHSRAIKEPRFRQTSRSYAFFNQTDRLADSQCFEATSYAQHCCKKSIIYSQITHQKLRQNPKTVYFQKGTSQYTS